MAAEILVLSPLDQLWVLVAGCLVFSMQAGFLCVEAGFSRAKHSMNVAAKNVTDFLAASVAFFFLGYGLMFGRSWAGLVGVSDFAPAWVAPGQATFFFFQLVFCGTAATIVSGAMAERMKFSGYLAYSFFISGLLYPLFGHWAWGGAFYLGQQGWLAGLGYLDFAGSSVVHQVGGWVALAGIAVLGPRLGKFDAQGRPRRMIGHNIPLALLGVFILWLGWFGFNGGSTLKVGDLVGEVVVNTNLAGAVGALGALAIGWPLRRRPDIGDIANGALGGLVAITASAAYVSAVAAMWIGAVAGVVVVASAEWLERGLKLDDVVGAVPVHAFCGLWGVLAAALFARPEALLHPDNRWYHLGIQALGSAACFLVAFGGGWAFFTLLHRTLGIRVSPEAERHGLNFSEHQAVSSLQELAGTMQEIAHGRDWARRAEVDPYADAGELGEHFNRLLDVTEQTFRALEEKERMLALSAEELQRANAELREKLNELEVLNRSMMGREERIMELKERLRSLEARQGA
jgi:Amt family ammonium transporter